MDGYDRRPERWESSLCATTARRHGISRSQLYEWRRLARSRQLVVGSPVGGFIPAFPQALPSSAPMKE
ncbi:transposase [Neorhizobium huautlense]|uniref:transposase n=1 Tax=Neorhizobium huautlense TaxID=67774 RepID=UPI000CF85B93